ncbi:MAG TPA: ABC transporter ATP-binding protein, partial [Bacteroidales bacterium]|nr:ABC transporter ATP-binding protein [Bacteroidales bacterium]
MTESMLKSLMNLFALLATINVDATRIFSRNFVESYLKGQFSPKLIDSSMQFFDQSMEELSSIRDHSLHKRVSLLSVKILRICNEINSELHLRSKYLILISIIQFAKHFIAQSESTGEYKNTIMDAVNTIADSMMINEPEYRNCLSFITDRFYKVPDRTALMVVNSMERFSISEIKHYQKTGLHGQFFFLRINQADLYIFYYSGNELLELGGKSVFPNHIYILPKGSAIKAEHFSPIYHGDIVTAFSKDKAYPKIQLLAKDIEFTYPNSSNGVHQLNMEFTAGEMIGVMGGSGTGKSTLMSVLNGTIVPDKGQILINGHDLIADSDALEGMIGYVPQDDLLIEELTVFENLYYNAKLCLGDTSEKEIIKRIGKVLNDLGLFYIKDLKVGSPLNKFISGGQRKRLNIALELIRQPYVLFVDEPTSGLSSTDSE